MVKFWDLDAVVIELGAPTSFTFVVVPSGLSRSELWICVIAAESVSRCWFVR